MKHPFLICLTIALFVGLVLVQDIPSNCSNPIFSKESFQARSQTRPRFLDAPQSNNTLSFCKLFSNKSSCCDQTTDDDISTLFNAYKTVLANVTSRKFRAIKQGFENYSSIDYKGTPNSDAAKTAVEKKLSMIKDNLKETTKQAVGCAQATLKMTAGLLCSGCNPYWGRFVKNSKFVLSNNSCMALSNACYKLVSSYKNLQNDSKSDVANLTDTITSYIGEDLPVGSQDLGQSSSRILGTKATPKPDPKINRPSGSEANYDITKFCQPWIDAKLTTLEDCKVCYFLPQNLQTENQIKTQLDGISPDCINNVMFKQMSDFSSKSVLSQGNILQLKDMLGIMSLFIPISDNGYFPVILKVTVDSQTLLLPFGTSNSTLNNYIVKFLSSKANVATKKAKIDFLTKGVVSALNDYLFGYTLSSYLNDIDNRALYRNSPKFASQEVVKGLYQKDFPLQFKCLWAGQKFILTEQGLDVQSNFINTITLSGTETGNGLNIALKNNQKTPLKVTPSKLVDFLNNCTKNNLPVDALRFVLGCSEGTCITCDDTYCFLSNRIATTLNAEPKQKNESIDSFNQINKTGQDPKKVSLNTGRKIPDNIDIPSDVDNVTSYQYTAPCANVSDCSNWFCNKFINGPFARAEKLLNPQDAKEDLENDASAAYNTALNGTSKTRILQTASQAEISDNGLNFFAVAENTGVNTTVVIDGVGDASSDFDTTIKANTTLDIGSAGGGNSSAGGGNSSAGGGNSSAGGGNSSASGGNSSQGSNWAENLSVLGLLNIIIALLFIL